MNFPETENPQNDELRDELSLLAARGKIKYSEKFIKKASTKQLEKIKHEYDRQQMEFVDGLVVKYLVNGLTTMLERYDCIDEGKSEEMRKTLLGNDLVTKDLSEVSGFITRNVKYIGIATLVAVTGGYIISKRYGKKTVETERGPNKTNPKKGQDDR